MTDRITLHSFRTPAGVRVWYARVIRKIGRCIVCQSPLLSRLSPAKRAALEPQLTDQVGRFTDRTAAVLHSVGDRG